MLPTNHLLFSVAPSYIQGKDKILSFYLKFSRFKKLIFLFYFIMQGVNNSKSGKTAVLLKFSDILFPISIRGRREVRLRLPILIGFVLPIKLFTWLRPCYVKVNPLQSQRIAANKVIILAKGQLAILVSDSAPRPQRSSQMRMYWSFQLKFRILLQTKTAELLGHTERILHLAISPDGSTVVRIPIKLIMKYF